MRNKIVSLLDYISHNSYQTKLFFIFSFIVFGLTISLISFSFNSYYQNEYLSQQLKNTLQKEIEEKSNLLHTNINSYKQIIKSIDNNVIFKTFIEKPTEIHEKNILSLFEYITATNKNIMQLRYIKNDGHEILRVEKSSPISQVKIVAKKFLQNKKDRYYFSQSIKLSSNKIWLSNIDLNMEHNKIEIPYNPTLRITTPVYLNNKIQGILVINIFMKDILNKLTDSTLFNISLIDENGEYLIGYIKNLNQVINLSWSEQLKKNYTLKVYLPNQYNQILNSDYFEDESIFSKNISSNLGLHKKVFLLFELNKTKYNELKLYNLHIILTMLIFISIISVIIGILLSYIPSKLALMLIKSKNNLDSTTLLFNQYLKAMDHTNIISKSDLKGTITYINDNFTKVSGYTQEDALGMPHSLLRDEDTPKETFKELWSTIQAGKTWRGILKNKKKNNGIYYVDIVIAPIKDQDGRIIEYLAIRHEITELIKQRQELIEITIKDPLTGFGNKYKLTQDIHSHKHNNLAIIVIDQFPSISDFYGDKLSDILIKKFSLLLYENITNDFSLYRIHADKFAILNFNYSKEDFINFITSLNNKMIESIIDTDIKSFDIVTTSGISCEKNSEIFTTANIANKHAKKVKQHVLIYDKNLQIEKEFEDNILWTEKVKKALLDDRIVVYYQPIYNYATKEIEKYESLVRLIDEDGTLISPFFFLDIAKSSKQYIDITKKVIKASFEKFHNLDKEFSINLTIEDIINEDLKNYLIEMINKYNVANKLVIELVESEGIESFEIIELFLAKLKTLGCRIAIDDFGTGYSNFEYLIKIDAHYIKIDGSMIKNITTDNNSKEIVKTIILFAKKMNFKTIAEYVWDEEIFNEVNNLGIDYAQGFYVGRPTEQI